MGGAIPTLARAPEARTETVDDLVLYARRGKLRVPRFQRPLKWDSDDVLSFFDSLYRGLPIGALLVWKRQGPAERVHLGPLLIDAEQLSDAWYVVDGQQRLTSLAAGLGRPWPPPLDATDPFLVLFDAASQTFLTLRGAVPSTAVPLPELLDAAQLGEWLITWPHSRDRELRQRVFEAGKRLREYRVPMYVVETNDEEVLREIFYRTNKRGKQLEWTEVHDAIFRHRGGPPSTVTELGNEVAELGFGRISDRQLLSCLIAIRGGDVTRSPDDHLEEDRSLLDGAVGEGLAALRSALLFLRVHAGIPHERILPRAWLLEPLSRFFALHPEPSTRSRELLVRWTWRTFLSARALEDRTIRRGAVAAVGDNEEQSIQALLSLVPRTPVELDLPERFDARAAESRVALLALIGFGPRNLINGAQTDVAALVEAEDAGAFGNIVDDRHSLFNGTHGPENRIVHGSIPQLHAELVRRCSLGKTTAGDEILRSHAIDEQAARLFHAGDFEGFLTARRSAISEMLRILADEKCGWSRNDRDRPALRVRKLPRREDT
jgi:hypothetical protein